MLNWFSKIINFFIIQESVDEVALADGCTL